MYTGIELTKIETTGKPTRKADIGNIIFYAQITNAARETYWLGCKEGDNTTGGGVVRGRNHNGNEMFLSGI